MIIIIVYIIIIHTIFYFEVTCDFPTPPINGSVSDYLDNRIGATVTYQCNDGFIPSVEMTAICSNETVSWLPAPDQHVCIFFVEGM